MTRHHQSTSERECRRTIKMRRWHYDPCVDEMDNDNRFVVRRKRNLLADSWVVGKESFNSDEREEQANQAPQNSLHLREPLLPSQEPQECIQDEQPNEVQSRNINLILAFTLFAFAGRSLWSQSVLSTLVYLLRDDNPEAVGFITGVMGMSQLIASFPTGVWADRHRRDSMLKVSSGVGCLAVAVTLFSVWKESYIWLTVALAIWGVFWGVASTSLSALFADSIQEGDRSLYFTKRSIILKMGNCTGPFVALILFAVLGDKWTIRDCSIVMNAGQLICLPAMFILCCLNDDDAIPPHDDDNDEQSQTVVPSTEGSTDESESSIQENTILERETGRHAGLPNTAIVAFQSIDSFRYSLRRPTYFQASVPVYRFATFQSSFSTISS